MIIYELQYMYVRGGGGVGVPRFALSPLLRALMYDVQLLQLLLVCVYLVHVHNQRACCSGHTIVKTLQFISRAQKCACSDAHSYATPVTHDAYVVFVCVLVCFTVATVWWKSTHK